MKKFIPVIRIVLVACAIVAAVWLIIFATGKMNDNPNAVTDLLNPHH